MASKKALNKATDLALTSTKKNSERKSASAESEEASSLDNTCKAAIKTVSRLTDAAFQTILIIEKLKERDASEQGTKAWDDIIEKFDDTLALMARNLSGYIRIRGEKTRSKELLFHIYGETLGGMERFSSIWERCVETEVEEMSPDSPGYWLLSGLVNTVRIFERECERRPGLFKYWAEEQPCLPMLVFKHKAGYRKRFSRLAESTNLGARSPINVSPRANYSLETPINDRVFEILMDYMNAHDWITFAREGNPTKAWRNGATIEDQLAEQAHIPRKMQPVHFAAYDLPQLTKATAHKWADVYVMPYLDASGCDFMSAPEFAPIRKRQRVKSAATMRAEVRKDVIRSLVGMARPLSPNHCNCSAKPC